MARFRLLLIAFGGLLLLSLVITLAAPRPLTGDRSKPPLTILLNDWNTQQVFSHIVGQLLERRGQSVEYRESDTVLQFDALARGDAHFQVAVWHNRMADDLDYALDRGVIHAGHHALRFTDGWWVSDATLSACPDAGTWDGLVACAQRRADTLVGEGEDPTTRQLGGHFIAPPAAFNRDYSDRVGLLGMPFHVIPADSLDALKATWAAFDAETAMADGPVQAVYNWSPNALPGPVNGQFVAFPEPELACFRDPDWGPNPDLTGDCGDPAYFPVSKAAWAGVLDRYPESWPLLRAIQFDSIDYRQISAWMRAPAAEPRTVAQRWINANADRVEAWL